MTSSSKLDVNELLTPALIVDTDVVRHNTTASGESATLSTPNRHPAKTSDRFRPVMDGCPTARELIHNVYG